MLKKGKNVEELIPLILGAVRALHSHLKKNHGLDFSRISPLKIQTLGFIKKQKNPLMKDVADFLAITPPSATSLIESLAKDKLIIRHFDHKDRRVVHLRITDKGSRILSKGFKEMICHMKEVFTCLTEKEKKQLIGIYRKIYNFNNK